MKIEGSNHASMIMETAHAKKMAQHQIKHGEFENLMGKQKVEEDDKMKKISEMIDNIEKVKGELEHDLSVENLEKYKDALRSFLNYYTKNELKMDYYFVKDSRTFIEKKVGIIQSIDEKMNDLTENMLETNKGHLDMLHKMGEIQGLIVNLFM